MPGDYDSETPKLCRARCRHRRRHLFAYDQVFVETLAGQGRGDNGRVCVVRECIVGSHTATRTRQWSRHRIVVDEAGMGGLQTANVLVELALEQRVGIAFVGDPHQALPVGHAGAMGSAIRYANAAVELDTVHRFREPEYAALTLRLREASDREGALAVAGELAERGHVVRVDHRDAARERMIDAYFEWHSRGKRVTLVSGTNAEADAINDAIQQRRVDQGELEPRGAARGMGGAAPPGRRHRADPSQRQGHRRREPCAVDRARHPRRLRGPCVGGRQRRAAARVCRVCAGACAVLLRVDGARHAGRQTPPTRQWSGPTWVPQGYMSVSPAGGCITPGSSSRGRIPRPEIASRSRCGAATPS
ncbi:AAA family ATPase [Microbacterium lacticum]|uniref:AAA family ATPase n=1 Tax=Microbacterium lacticum TaxID=33885 RepID=UPI0028BDB72D|nr:AAA family ATPase [Microbacterium lacticum]